MLISVHLPKTAGTSFRDVLQSHFGEDLRLDYGDVPINRTPLCRKSIALTSMTRYALRPPRGPRCIHGHFLAVKYRCIRDASFVMWLRDPAERLASHYHFWRKTFDPKTAPPLHQRMMDEGWSLERFCLGPELRNLYHIFLWGLPRERIAYIGVSEHFDEDLPEFSRRVLGQTYEAPRKNTGLSPPSSVYFEDPELRARVVQHHRRDMDLYEYALRLRENEREIARNSDPTPL